MTEKEFKTKFLATKSLSEQQRNSVAELTKLQSKSEFWFSQRRGKITASIVKEVCAKVEGDSICKDCTSLSNRILSKMAPIFTPAIVHGQRFEEKACKLALLHLEKSHNEMISTNCGSYLSIDYPFLSSSPDRILSCKCCGNSVLEVKNPFVGRSLSILDFSKSKQSCLEIVDNKFFLKRTHQYYYQVQFQMFTVGVNQGFFCIRTSHKDGLFVEKIVRNDAFINDVICKCKTFFNLVLLRDMYLMYSKCNKSVTSETCDINASNCDVTLADFDTAQNVEILSNDTCPECKCICIENPVRFCDHSIECSKCLY